MKTINQIPSQPKNKKPKKENFFLCNTYSSINEKNIENENNKKNINETFYFYPSPQNYNNFDFY